EAMLSRYSQGRKQLVTYGSASTNDLGEYRIFGLPPGRYFVSVSPRRNYAFRGGSGVSQPPSEEEYVATYYPGSADLAAASPLEVGNSNLENLRITINPPVSLSGRVRVDGQATVSLSAIQLSLRPRDPGGAMFGSGNVTVKVKEDGSFNWSNVSPDEYRLTL